MVSRKWNEKLSVQFSPTLVHKNLTEFDSEKNMQFILAAGGRYKLSKRISLNMDYEPSIQCMMCHVMKHPCMIKERAYDIITKPNTS